MFTKDYWENRVSKHGHTGHGEPFFYSFDQQARKFAVSELIHKLDFSKKENALDFGCGSGDFISILKDFRTITGYDISTRVLAKAGEQHNDPSLTLTNDLEKVKSNAFYDLIITVTVLQGFAEEELKSAIELFSEVLLENGYMICMEFFSTDESNAAIKETRITIDKWKSTLKEKGLFITAQHSFYNSIYNPTKSWEIYDGDLFIKALKPFKHLSLIKNYFSKRAKEIISHQRDILLSENSNFTIYIVQKKTHAN